MKIVLIGFMGSGKSKVGRILAQRLGWTHHDTDEMITKQVGKPVGEIIRAIGEDKFRETEKKAVALVSILDHVVISTGGGVPTVPENMKQLSQNAAVVWLKVSPEMALVRVQNLAARPLIDPADPLGSIQKRMADREKNYAEARHTVDTDQKTPPQVADEILALIPALKK